MRVKKSYAKEEEKVMKKALVFMLIAAALFLVPAFATAASRETGFH